MKGTLAHAQAIFQCIQGLPEGGLRRIILTASGGAFRDWPVEKLKEVRAADAIKHPNWRCACPPLFCSWLRVVHQKRAMVQPLCELPEYPESLQLGCALVVLCCLPAELDMPT